MGTEELLKQNSLSRDQIVCTMDQDFVKKRLEKDLEDLKRMIALHFEQRKKDETELEELKSRIDKRKQMREEQLRLRAERERERQEFERLEKERKAEEEAARKAEEELKKKEAMAALSTSFGGYKPHREQTKLTVKRRRRNLLNVESHLTLTILKVTKFKKRLTKCTNVFVNSKKRDP